MDITAVDYDKERKRYLSDRSLYKLDSEKSADSLIHKLATKGSIDRVDLRWESQFQGKRTERRAILPLSTWFCCRCLALDLSVEWSGQDEKLFTASFTYDPRQWSLQSHFYFVATTGLSNAHERTFLNTPSYARGFNVLEECGKDHPTHATAFVLRMASKPF